MTVCTPWRSRGSPLLRYSTCHARLGPGSSDWYRDCLSSVEHDSRSHPFLIISSIVCSLRFLSHSLFFCFHPWGNRLNNLRERGSEVGWMAIEVDDLMKQIQWYSNRLLLFFGVTWYNTEYLTTGNSIDKLSWVTPSLGFVPGYCWHSYITYFDVTDWNIVHSLYHVFRRAWHQLITLSMFTNVQVDQSVNHVSGCDLLFCLVNTPRWKFVYRCVFSHKPPSVFVLLPNDLFHSLQQFPSPDRNADDVYQRLLISDCWDICQE